ncbi:MAG: M48 family metallopeptidase [Bacteroidaceae bacterium]|nr:M48 family metallopeptidase [Bacteroidaceae bacterium]
MKKTFRLLFFAALTLLTVACGTTNTVPITGRKTRLLVSDEQILSLSTQQYQEYMKGAKASTDQNNTMLVKHVGQKLATAVETFLTNNGYANEIKNFQWEFNLVADNQVNAFCMPGGKIVVYEGLLPVTQNEASLAIVLGHEIAHAVAKHSAEQLSKQMRQQYATKIGGAVVGTATGSSAVSSVLTSVASAGFNFANLKYSRDNETEADHLGLIFAAMAGYDPQQAIPFWQRMAQLGGNKKSEFFSDHPSDEKRIAALQKEMPEALKYYTPPAPQPVAKKTTTTKKKTTTTKKKTTTTKKTTTKKK